MNIRDYLTDLRDRVEVIAIFGEAQLVRTLDLKYELRGGTPEDRTAAREWISLFFHDAVVREVPSANQPAPDQRNV